MFDISLNGCGVPSPFQRTPIPTNPLDGRGLWGPLPPSQRTPRPLQLNTYEAFEPQLDEGL